MARHISNAIYRSAADMDTDVLIVGAGPHRIDARQSTRASRIRATIVAGIPGRHSRRGRWRCMRARSRSIRNSASRKRALALGKQGNAANMWRRGNGGHAFRSATIGKSLSPFPFVLMLGQDDNERIMGERLRDWGMAVQWNTELVSFEQAPDRVTATLKQPDGVTRSSSPRISPAATEGNSTVRERSGYHVSRRTVRARVLRRRYRGGRLHGAGRAERVPAARRIPSLLSDARDDRLARHRHPAKHLRERDDLTFEEAVPRYDTRPERRSR